MGFSYVWLVTFSPYDDFLRTIFSAAFELFQFFGTGNYKIHKNFFIVFRRYTCHLKCIFIESRVDCFNCYYQLLDNFHSTWFFDDKFGYGKCENLVSKCQTSRKPIFQKQRWKYSLVITCLNSPRVFKEIYKSGKWDESLLPKNSKTQKIQKEGW